MTTTWHRSRSPMSTRRVFLVLLIVTVTAIPAAAQRLDWERTFSEPGHTDPRSDGPAYYGSLLLTARNGEFVIQSDLTGSDYAISRTDSRGSMLWETRNVVGDTTRNPMIMWEDVSGEIGIAGNAFPLGPLSGGGFFFYQYHQYDGRSESPRISLLQTDDTTREPVLLDRPGAVVRLDDGSFIAAMQLDFPSHNIAVSLSGVADDGGRSTWWSTAPAYDSGSIAIPLQMLRLSGGDFAVVGYWRIPNGTTRSMVIRCDSVGGVRWSVAPAGISEWRASRSAVSDGDGLILLSYEKWTEAGVNRQDIVMTRLKADGTVDWERKYRSPYPYSTCEELARTPDGGLVAVGRASSYSNSHSWGDSTRFYVIRTDGRGNELWSRVWGNGYRDMLAAATIDSGGGMVVAGMTGANRDLYLARLVDEPAVVPPDRLRSHGVRIIAARSEGNDVVVELDAPDDEPIAIDVADMLGRMVGGASGLQCPVGGASLRVPTPALSAGTYLVRARAGDCVASARLVVMP